MGNIIRDTGGELIEKSTWTGSNTGDVDFTFPDSNEFSHFDCYYEIFGTGIGNQFYTQVKNAAGTRLNMEFAYYYWNNGGSSGFTATGASTWQSIGQSYDMFSETWVHARIQAGTHNRPGILIDVNSTRSGVGAQRLSGSMHHAGTVAYKSLGFNVDGTGAITRVNYRCIGYRQ